MPPEVQAYLNHLADDFPADIPALVEGGGEIDAAAHAVGNEAFALGEHIHGIEIIDRRIRDRGVIGAAGFLACYLCL